MNEFSLELIEFQFLSHLSGVCRQKYTKWKKYSYSFENFFEYSYRICIHIEWPRSDQSPYCFAFFYRKCMEKAFFKSWPYVAPTEWHWFRWSTMEMIATSLYFKAQKEFFRNSTTVKSHGTWKPKNPVFSANWRSWISLKMHSNTTTFAFIIFRTPKNHILKKIRSKTLFVIEFFVVKLWNKMFASILFSTQKLGMSWFFLCNFFYVVVWKESRHIF